MFFFVHNYVKFHFSTNFDKWILYSKIVGSENMNFYIYENDLKYVKCCKELINKMFFPLSLSYKIKEIKDVKEFIKDTNKVLILNPKLHDADSLVEQLRNSGDYRTPIICLLKKSEMLYFIEHNCSLWFSTLCVKNHNFSEQFMNRLYNILRFYKQQPSLSIIQNGEIYKILYQDILYIEKELYTNQCRIVTINASFSIRSSVKQIEQKLGCESNFFKCHQSCIVNLQNVIHIDFASNKIYFEKGDLSLLSRSRKQELKIKFQLYQT